MNKSIQQLQFEKRVEEYYSKPKLCSNCNSVIGYQQKDNIYCSSKCSATVNNRKRKESGWSRSAESKLKTSLALKGRKYPNKLKREFRNCEKCGSTFLTRPSSTRRFCSSQCRPKSPGGYREGSGRSKHGYYKGIYCGSTYELAWVIYQLDHGVIPTRFQGFVTCKETGQKYYPDFIQGRTIIEIKGYESVESVSIKTNIAISHGYEVLVLRKTDLTKEFQHVKENYKFKCMSELYDGYKPIYHKVCSSCGKKFATDKKLKTKEVYCSRICAGRGANKIRYQNNGVDEGFKSVPC